MLNNLLNYFIEILTTTNITVIGYIFIGIIVAIVSTFLLGFGKHGKFLYKNILILKDKIEKKKEKREKERKEKIKKSRIKKDFIKNGYILNWNIIYSHIKISDLYYDERNLPLKYIIIRIFIDVNTDEIVFVPQNKTKEIRINKKYNLYQNKSLLNEIIDEIYRENECIEYWTNKLKTEYDNSHTFMNYKHNFEEIHNSFLYDFLIVKLNEDNRYKTL